MLVIDGTRGEGGGQILRSALALAMATGTPCRIEGIRAGRKKPGLMRQHLTSLQAATRVCNAEVQGDEIGSREVSFRPRAVQPGHYEFSIGTAGSTTLVLQTVLIPLLTAESPSTIALEGGTHNPLAPPFDFLARAYLPLVERMGPKVSASLIRPGFFPAGGGRFEVAIEPRGPLQALQLNERGELRSRRARVLIANLPSHVATRERTALEKDLGWPSDAITIETVKESHGPGNIVLIEIESANVCEVFTAVGSVAVPAERVARNASREARRYLTGTAPVAAHLTDQLLLPMACAGRGQFLSVGLTRHATTHIDLIHQFLDVTIATERQPNGETLITIGSQPAS